MLMFGLLNVQAAEELKKGPVLPVKCGTIVQGEFLENYQYDTYEVDMKAGEKFSVTGVPLGDNLSFRIDARDRKSNLIAFTDAQQDNNSGYVRLKRSLYFRQVFCPPQARTRYSRLIIMHTSKVHLAMITELQGALEYIPFISVVS
jgi:hypothetical protein